MNLKGRLITAFFLMIAIPTLLLVISGGTIIKYQVKSIHQSYDVRTDTKQLITNPIQILNRLTRGVYNEIKLSALKYPLRFEDKNYIETLNQDLESKYSFLAVRKNGVFIYTGSKEKLNFVKNSLPKFGVYNTDVDGGIYIEGRNPFLVKAQDFYYSDGGEGTIFVLTDLNTLVPQIKAVAIQTTVAFLIIIFLTALILMYWIYHSILKPLNILRIATNQMKDGDLDYAVKSVSQDEIGELCEDFEEMRVRLKQLIEDRMQYEEDMKELMTNISHDLKTPLTAIKGYTEGIMDGVADTPEKKDKYLRTIYMKANDMSVLVDELSFYAQIDCNTIPYSFKKINLHDYFDDCIEDLSLDFEIGNIDVIYDNEIDSKVTVVADAEQLKRVIHNIIGNSVKYGDKEEGKIQIHIHDIGKYVQIDLKDNGRGIAKDELSHIFERFYRGDASRNSNKGGSGLGLAIAKKIIEDHSGDIWASSEEGKGTTISFTLKKTKEA